MKPRKEDAKRSVTDRTRLGVKRAEQRASKEIGNLRPYTPKNNGSEKKADDGTSSSL